MATWTEHDLEQRIIGILGEVPLVNPDGHHFGRPFLTAYQLAIELERRWPDAVEAIGKPVGGRGSGQHDSLAQYIANQLSRRIKADRAYPIEGAFVSNQYVDELRYRRPTGEPMVASHAGGPYDLSMYRLARKQLG